MTSPISAGPPVTHAAIIAPPRAVSASPASLSARPAAPALSASGSGSRAQATAALNRLLTKYKNDLSHGAPANTLSSLGRQIMTAAKAAGQHVTLPRGSAGASAAKQAPVAEKTAPEPAKVDVTA